MTEVAERSQS